MVFSQDGSVPDDGLRLIIDQAQKSLKIAKPISVDEVADFTVLREAQKELGLRGNEEMPWTIKRNFIGIRI
jgi:hypothetical protein